MKLKEKLQNLGKKIVQGLKKVVKTIVEAIPNLLKMLVGIGIGATMAAVHTNLVPANPVAGIFNTIGLLMLGLLLTKAANDYIDATNAELIELGDELKNLWSLNSQKGVAA